MIIFNNVGDWGLGIGPNPQSPIPNPQLTYLFNKLIILFKLIYSLQNINKTIIHYLIH